MQLADDLVGDHAQMQLSVVGCWWLLTNLQSNCHLLTNLQLQLQLVVHCMLTTLLQLILF